MFVKAVNGKLIKVKREVEAIKMDPDNFVVDCPSLHYLYPEKKGRPNKSKLPSLIQVLDDSEEEEEEKKALEEEQ